MKPPPSYSYYINIIMSYQVVTISGVNTVVAPMYLSEIAPVHVRGSLGTLSQFGIVTGLLLGNILGLKWVRNCLVNLNT